jgi:putative protease
MYAWLKKSYGRMIGPLVKESNQKLWSLQQVENGGSAMDIRIGHVTHYYNRIGVAVLELTGELNLGDWILLLGHTTDFSQRVESMEIEHRKIQSARGGMEVALKVEAPVRKGDSIYRVVETANIG